MEKISKIFHISNGNGFALSNMELDISGCNFIARGEKNNGVVDKVKVLTNVKPFSANQITVALSGSVLESFYQTEPFYTAYHIKVLSPKKPMTPNQMLFYCLAIRSNKYRYSFGRQANKTLDDVLVPSRNEIPKWVNKAEIPKEPSDKPKRHKSVSLKDRKWRWFSCENIFDIIDKCKRSNAEGLLTDGDDINYIGAKKTNNGFMRRVKKADKLVSEGNCIVFIGDGQGSVGYTTYQENDFIGSSTLSCGYSTKLNEYNALFIVSVLDLERYKYSFGRKYGKDQVKKSKIKLPVKKDGEPDWQFMEYYIKSLPYSINLKEDKKEKGLSDAELVEKYEAGKIDLGKKLKKAIKQ